FVESITKKETTSWRIRNKNDNKVEYLEGNEDLSFFNKRRLEFVIHTNTSKKHNFEKKTLIDSTGNKVSVNVVDLHEFIASKIHKLYVVKDGVDTKVDRHTDDRDIADLRRLLQQTDFNSQSILTAIRKEFLDNIDDNEAAKKIAQKELDYAMSLL
ncbi:MAG: nucleotidyl transferase AbiEii/AbiGii toxin family protein, partial [Candidatus Sifarchaeia archaeon]